MDEEAKPNSSEDASTKAHAAAAPAATVAESASSPMPSVEGEEEVGDLVEKLAELVDEIAAISDFRNAYRRQFCNLSRRIRLLAPMLEEAKEGPRPLPEGSVATLRQLKEALAGARELLCLGSNGSKIFLIWLEKGSYVPPEYVPLYGLDTEEDCVPAVEENVAACHKLSRDPTQWSSGICACFDAPQSCMLLSDL